MQSPEADRSAVDASTESVSNNATQSGVSKEPDELPAKEDENKVENPEPSTETDVPVEEEPAQMPTLMLSIDGTPVTTYISSATKRGSSTFVCTLYAMLMPRERLKAVCSRRCCKSCWVMPASKQQWIGMFM